MKYNQFLAGLPPECLAPSSGTPAASNPPPPLPPPPNPPRTPSCKPAKVLPAQVASPCLPQLQREPVPLRKRAGVSSQADPLQPGETTRFFHRLPGTVSSRNRRNPGIPTPASAPRETQRQRSFEPLRRCHYSGTLYTLARTSPPTQHVPSPPLTPREDCGTQPPGNPPALPSRSDPRSRVRLPQE